MPLLVLGSGAAFLSGCAQLENLLAGATPIAEVQAEPGNYSEVTVRGEVVNQIGILGRGAYQLRDRSGEIWVVTQAGLPEMGQTIAVAGKAEAGIAIGGQSLGVTLTESERR
ncbi:MAG: hypothetical protein AAFY57_17975 [Cyanobacteria bacterium J06642_2]